MLEEYTELLNDLESNVNGLIEDLSGDFVERAGVNDAIREAVGRALLEAAQAAIKKTPEFQYKPLEQRLLENISNLDKHVIISGNEIQVFDEEFAGTYDDLVGGQKAGGGASNNVLAPVFWKYGIYLAHFGKQIQLRESRATAKKSNLPTYESVIEERLAYWGEKAPYWYFLEYGNAGNGRAYPSFSGTGFIAAIRGKAKEVYDKAIEIFESHLYYDVEHLTEEFADIQPKARTRITVYRYKVGGRKISIQKTSAGNYFYRVGNSYYRVDEFEEVIRRYL